MATHISTDRRKRRSVRQADAESGPPLTVASTSDRLVGECLDELMEQLARTDGRLPAASIASLARLVSAASALRYLHDVGRRPVHSLPGRGRVVAARPSAVLGLSSAGRVPRLRAEPVRSAVEAGEVRDVSGCGSASLP